MFNNLLHTIEQSYQAGQIDQEAFERIQVELATFSSLNLPELHEMYKEEVDFEEYEYFGKLDSTEELDKLNKKDRAAFIQYWHEHMDYSEKIDWNKLKRIKQKGFGGLYRSITSKFLTPPRHHDGKYISSGFEAYLLNCTPFKKCEYEPADAKMSYTVTKTWQPDARSPLNPKVCFEWKGAFRNREEANKYILCREQNDCAIVIVIESDEAELMYQDDRKDGTKQTMKEWCIKNKFPFCTHKNIRQFLKSDEYKWLVENT